MTTIAARLQAGVGDAVSADLEAEGQELEALSEDDLARIQVESDPVDIEVAPFAVMLTWRGRQLVPLERRTLPGGLVLTTLTESSFGAPAYWASAQSG